MLKQLFKNIFDKKNAKLEFKPHFVSGTLNYKSITEIEPSKCRLDFENQTFKISQNNQFLTGQMTDVSSIRSWVFKERLYLVIETKRHDEYLFSFPEIELNDLAIGLILKPLEIYAKEFGIFFEYQGTSKNNE